MATLGLIRERLWRRGAIPGPMQDPRALLQDPEPLPRSLLARDADLVARDLLGHLVVHAPRGGAVTAGRMVEAEAYFGPPGAHAHLADRRDLPRALARSLAAEGDPASHSHRGPTPRNRVMFGPPGIAYVYVIYGIHHCLNVSTGEEGRAEAVLLRALEPLRGLAAMRERRGVEEATALASGPGKLTEAMGITREAHDGVDLTSPPGLFLARGTPVDPERVRATPRIGVAAAEAHPLRFVVDDHPHASR